jgi:hypothetical protein
MTSTAGVRRQALSTIPELRGRQGVWLVGGAVRDHLLGRPVLDLDFTVAGPAAPLARRVADSLRGHCYTLDSARDTTRVLWTDSGGSRRRFDFAALRGRTIEDDLRARDYTINAMAVPMEGPEILVDPTGGAVDLDGKVLRACSPDSVLQDPIRAWRGVRIATELELAIASPTKDLLRAARGQLPHVSAERLRDELFRILEHERPAAALRSLDDLGILAPVIPAVPMETDRFVSGQRGIVDGLAAILSVLDGSQSHLSANQIPPGLSLDRLRKMGAPLQSHLKRDAGGGRPVRGLMFLAGLLFERSGGPSPAVVDRASALRLSRQEIGRMEGMLRVLPWAAEVATNPPSRRSVYRYFRASGPAGVEAALIGWAMAVCAAEDGGGGSGEVSASDRAIIAAALLESFLLFPSERVYPPPLVRGEDLMASCGIPQGPQVGRLLEIIREDQAAGVVASREQALARVQQELAQTP